MRVTVRLFARLREIAGANELVLDVEPPVTVAAVWSELARRHEALQPYAHSVSAARNLEYVRPNAEVVEGDEIAFLPPVSGGATDRVPSIDLVSSAFALWRPPSGGR